MTFNRKNNNVNVISVFKLVKNEELYEILWLFCQKLKIQDGRRRLFWIDANKHMKEKNEASPLHMFDDMCAQFQAFSKFAHTPIRVPAGANRGVGAQNGPEITHLFLIVDHLGHIFSEGGHCETRQ